ncbi:MAG TPA: right-handed parallel beta-helix repeat-containing protein [Tepidisphaeraceae bacterium]|jgi:hypothetical protein
MKKKRARGFCCVDHLELRRLLSTIFVSNSTAATTGSNNGTSWTNAYTNLQTAITNANSGDTIEVGQGTYTPGTQRSDSFGLKDGVSILGGYAGTGQSNPDARSVAQTPSVLSGDIGTLNDNSDNSYNVVSSNGNASTAVLDGFTITAGNANGGGDTSGGGINIGSSSPSISDCIITGNNAFFGGGGVVISGVNALTLSNCTISGNTAGTSGGGVYSFGSTIALTGCVITQNHSYGSGGGIMTAYDTSDTFTDCTITGNIATFDGAGVQNLHSSQTLINCVIAGNSGGQTGGGVNITTGTESLVNCTISGNSSTDFGGGISVKNASTATVTNCIVWGDTYPGGYDIYTTSDSSATITYSDVNGNVDSVDNDLNIDPKFVRNVGTNGASDYGDLHLQADSPVIDVGSNSAILGTTTDADGDGRIRNSTVDLGAYEYQLIFVDAHATGSNDGSSWTNAYTSLQSALAGSGNSAVIDVAQGTYYPTSGSSVTATFQLKDGVAIYGGFAGDTTSTPGTRSPQVYPTILSGDLGVQGPTNFSDNSNNVVIGSGTDSTAVLDGFTITAGNAQGGGKPYDGGGIYDNDGSPTINDCIITGNRSSVGNGGGIYNGNGSSPLITNTTISNNFAFSVGGGIDNRSNSSPTLINCSITGNTAQAGGGGVYDYAAATFIDCLLTGNSSPGNGFNPNTGSGGAIETENTGVLTLINCTIAQNTDVQGAGGIKNNSTAAPIITNSILWGDSANEIVSTHTPTITYSDIDQSGFAGSNHNIDTDPLFVNPSGGNFRLEPTSPGVDMGLNSAIAGTDTDVSGAPRINNGTVDMGAYEFQSTIYVDANAMGTDSGGSWADAFTTLTAALAVAIPGSGQVIDVAQGTYEPTTGTDRTATFQLLDNMSLYGGFAGDSTSNPGARNASLYPTILSGEIGAPGISDNSYHVVTSSGVSASTVLDGFTITAGNADASHTNYRGGGIYNNGGDLTINDCTITGNSSSDVGGGMYNENATVEMTDCFITGNTAYDSGGGIASQSTHLTIINSVIAANSANRGGGIFDSDVALTLTNCTVSGDTAILTPGGGLYGAISNESVTNCIFWGDTAQPGGNEIYSGINDTVTVTFSDIGQTGFAGTNGNINADPKFANAGSGDFRLVPPSPAIDTGSNSAIAGTDTDLAGDPRITNGTVDMGAYEFMSTIFVDANATGADNGSSWADAFTTLTAALAIASPGSGQIIDVGQGTYKPTAGTDRSMSFELINGVSLYGGFAGDNTGTPGVRNVALFPTILSGDIGTVGDNSDNSYHVVYVNNVSSTTVLDGFTITKGNANGNDYDQWGGGILNVSGAPTINDCTLTGNLADFGGGMFNYANAAPVLTNCIITGNTVTEGGGAMYNHAATPTLINCVVAGNTAAGSGGIADFYSSLVLTNCTITGNTATQFDGGGVYGFDSSETITNCIFWGDTAQTASNEIYDVSAQTVTITNSDIDQSGIAGSNGNIDADPMFLRNAGADGSTDYGDLNLKIGSPAIDAGSNAAISGTTTDLSGNPRIVNGTVDMGAYEAEPIIFVDANATGNNDGTSWANAFTTLTAGLSDALAGSLQSIDVAQGTYKPTTSSDRTATFQLLDGISIEGGFAGDTTSNPGARNIALFTTILSGDIGTMGDNSDNSYHVVTGNYTDSTAVLDGFTITGGNANSSSKGDDRDGGGVVDLYGSSTINECIISGNAAMNDGGGIYSYQSTLHLNECAITGNTAKEGGGIYSYIDSSDALTNCTISGNTASDKGGGIYNYDHTSATLVNCVISGNTAGNNGGAILNYHSTNTLINCTISGNTAGGNGGGIFNISYSTTTLSNCVLFGDTAPSGNEIFSDDSGSTTTLTFSDVNPADIAGTVNLDGTDINSDPLFVRNVGTNGPTDAGDLHLQNSSPVINIGSNAAIPNGITTDLDGNSRIVQGTVDMGAYEALFAHLVFNVSPPQSNTAGAALGVEVSIEDGNGNVVTTDNSSITLQIASGPSGALLHGTLTEAAQNGVGIFSGVNITQTGTYTISASDGSFPGATSNSFSVAPAAAASLVITQQPANAIAGQTTSPVVEVKDQYGNLAAGTTVSVALGTAPSGATVSGTTPIISGAVDSFSNLSLTKAGAYTLTFTDGSLPAVTSSTFTISNAAAAMLAFANQPADTIAGQTLSPITVEVEDQFGNPVVGDNSSVSLSSTPAGISGSIATNLGLAIFSNLSSTTPGTYTLTASDGVLTSATSNSFAITSGNITAVPTTLSISTEPTNATAGQPLPAIAVEVKDQNGNPVDGTSVTLSIASGPSGAHLGGTTTVSTINGIATFSNLSLDHPGSYTLTASNGSLPSVTTSSFTFAFAGPQLVFAAEPGNATAGAKIPAFRVSPEDINGNPLTTNKSKIKLTLSSGGKLIGSATGAVKNGAAIFSKLSIQKAGTYTLTATDPTFGSAISSTFTITAAAASKMVFNPQPGNASTTTPFNVSVELTDKYGNAVSDGSTVALVLGSHPKTAASLNLTSVVSDGFGDFDGITLATSGNYTLKASDGKAKATSKKFLVS